MGQLREFFIATGETPKPGQTVQVDPTVALKSGRHTAKIYSRDADGDRPAGAHWVLLEDSGQGKTVDDAYAAGDICRAYAPMAGDQLNLLFKNVAGTADDVVAGDLFILDSGTGKVIVTTGSPEAEVAMALEAVADPTADTLVWSEWAGN